MAEIVPPILMLNNDCLLKIFAYFDVVQLIELESVCRRFADVIQVEYKRRRDFVYKEYEEAYGDRFKTLEVYQKIFERIGPNLQLLDLNWEHPKPVTVSYFAMMLQYSEKLEYVRFRHAFDVFFYEKSVDVLEERSPQLKTLDIGGFPQMLLDLNKSNNQFLRDASNLETLRLYEVNLRQCGGKWYSWFPKLKEASITFCKMDIRQMENFCKFHRNSLEVLELNYGQLYENYEKRLDAITTNFMNIKRLKITLIFKSKSLPNLKSIANLPHLTDLHIYGFQPIKDLLEALAERDILERLYIGDNHEDPAELRLSDEMLKPLRKFRNLKSLTIESRHLNDKFLPALPLDDSLEYLCLDYVNITDHGICFLLQQGQSLRTVTLSAESYVPKGVAEKDFADKFEPFARDRLHPLTLEIVGTHGYCNIPDMNIPGLKIFRIVHLDQKNHFVP